MSVQFTNWDLGCDTCFVNDRDVIVHKMDGPEMGGAEKKSFSALEAEIGRQPPIS